jgi:hypothetical protein
MEQTAERSFRSRVERLIEEQVTDLVAHERFRHLVEGRAGRAEYDAFLESVARAHLKSPQLLAFLYALAPPAAASDLLHNLLEELGIEDAAGTPHPALLGRLLDGAGLGARRPEIERQAEADIRRVVTEPLLYGSLRDVGLAALTEIVAFEVMLSRVAGLLAWALHVHRGLSLEALDWFVHHSEVDVRHAEQGLDGLEAYVRAYELAEDEALAIAELTLRENVFVRRYFRDALPAALGLAS